MKWAEKTIEKEVSVLIEKVSEKKYSGWTENYLACDETNFIPYPEQTIAR
jgi:hypothetical protein